MEEFLKEEIERLLDIYKEENKETVAHEILTKRYHKYESLIADINETIKEIDKDSAHVIHTNKTKIKLFEDMQREVIDAILYLVNVKK